MGDTVSSPDSYTYGIVRFAALRNVQSRALSDGLQFINKLDLCTFAAEKDEKGYYDVLSSIAPERLY